MGNCKHETPQWHLADCNEDGWKCAECGHAFGFRPDFDRGHLVDKVDTILFWLHEHDFMYVSNESEGSGVVAQVVRQCRAADEYDQQTIVYLITAIGRDSHAAFWRDQAKQAMCSHPSRGLSVEGDKLICHACRHELPVKSDSGPLFASKERF